MVLTKSKMANRYSPEVRARAVRMVFEHPGSYETQAGTIAAIAPKIGCIPQTWSGWVKQAEKDSGMAEAGVEPSVGSVGDSYDNALAETINGLYKTELIHRQGPWRNMQDLEMTTLGWVDWFNNRRLLGPIGVIPPPEADENFYVQRDLLDMVA